VADFFFGGQIMKSDPLFLYRRFAGRRLLWSEIMKSLEKIDEKQLQTALDVLEEQGYVTKEPSIQTSFWAIRKKCNRCGAGSLYLEKSSCAICKERSCVYCTKCLHRGRAKSCSFIYSFQPMSQSIDFHSEPSYPLQPAQQKTLVDIQKLLHGQSRSIYVVMVAGAGKISILAALFQQLLSEQKNIFWCLPDKGVEQNLNQMKLLMPNLVKQCLHQSFVVGTKWDLLSYHQQFDVLLLDGIEVPAFYSNGALAKEGQQVHVSLPFPKNHQTPLVVHPVRLHQYPLPIPKFIHYRGLRRGLQFNKPVEPLRLFIEEIQSLNGQAWIVVPSKKDGKMVMDWIEKVMPLIKDKSRMIGEENENAEELRILFSEQKFTFLITPHYLLKSIRIANLHLCVLFAEHSSVERKRLVEMSQLVGIHAYFPSCEVWFVGEENTNTIVQTKKEHIYLNELAKKEGYLNERA
jgi:competence protein ComFA